MVVEIAEELKTPELVEEYNRQGVANIYVVIIDENTPLGIEFSQDIVPEGTFPDLPIRIDEYDTVDISFFVVMTIDSRLLDLRHSFSPSSESSWEKANEGYRPLNFEYHLELANGEVATSSQTPCYYIREK